MGDLGRTRNSDTRRAKRELETEPPGAVKLVSAGQDDARECSLEPECEYTVGRDASDADFVFDDADVSRAHGRLFYDEDAEHWLYRDLGSTNGSFLGPERTLIKADTPLEVGDVIFVGGDKSQLRFLRESPDDGSSRLARQLTEELDAASTNDQPVVLYGPSGSGKTHNAKVIHHRSLEHPEWTGVKEDRFISTNCGALSDDVNALKSEFFGHVEGGYSGATSAKLGKVFAAEGGTLFLDEIESLTAKAAAFLLDILDGTARATPLGGDERRAVPLPKFRIISTTKLPLSELSLRGDLFNRLTTGNIVTLPRLSDRPEDIPTIVEEKLKTLAKNRGVKHALEPAALSRLVAYAWPHERRELDGVCTMAFHRAVAKTASGQTVVIKAEQVEAELAKRRAIYGASTGGPKVTAAGAPGLTKESVTRALAETKGRILPAARLLGVSRTTLRDRMDEFGIDRPQKRAT